MLQRYELNLKMKNVPQRKKVSLHKSANNFSTKKKNLFRRAVKFLPLSSKKRSSSLPESGTKVLLFFQLMDIINF